MNRTGIILRRNQNSTDIINVAADSPAARAGLNKGDVLVELNGLKAADTNVFTALYSILCNDDKLTCVVRRRDSKELRLIISQPRQGG